MEKKLSKRFIFLSIGVLLAMLLVITVIVNGVNFKVIVNQVDKIIDVLEANDGVFPGNMVDYYDDSEDEEFWDEVPYSTRYFIVIYDEISNISSIDVSNITSVSESDAVEYASLVVNEKEKGFLDNYRYRVCVTETQTMIIFVDCTHNMQIFYYFLNDMVFITSLTLVIFGIFAFLLASKVVYPIAQSYAKQKQFITDVTHEFKTPLAIIKANTEILELENPDSQWTESTTSQIARLDELIKRLAFLAKQEGHTDNPFGEEVDMSAMIKSCAADFDVLASSCGKDIVCYIEPDVNIKAQSITMKTLVTMLLDNAIKYADEGTTIVLRLYKDKHKVILQTENATSGLKAGKYEKWFERFYREDNSRGGGDMSFGIGLSTAQAIVQGLKGTISAKVSSESVVTIRVEI